MSLYKTEALLTLRLDTERSLVGAAVTRIRYKKPSGEVGYWTATVDSTVLEYEVAINDIDEEGVWQFQSYIEVGGQPGLGKIVKQVFEKNLL